MANTRVLWYVLVTLTAIPRVAASSFPTTGLRMIRKRRPSGQVATPRATQRLTPHQVNNYPHYCYKYVANIS